MISLGKYLFSLLFILVYIIFSSVVYYLFIPRVNEFKKAATWIMVITCTVSICTVSVLFIMYMNQILSSI